MDLSVIVVNWNSTGYLRECIASVYEFTRGISFEIIVVDNASPVQDFDGLAERFPAVRIIKSSQQRWLRQGQQSRVQAIIGGLRSFRES